MPFPIEIHYPKKSNQEIVLRTDRDWEHNIKPDRFDETCSYFSLPYNDIFYWKPCLLQDGQLHWSVGSNYLNLPGIEPIAQIWPCFFSYSGHLSSRMCIPNPNNPLRHFIRIYFPPGYEENTLKRYPTLYMHDGQNVFLEEEAYLGGEWKADETMQQLNLMNLINKVIVIAVYPQDRMREYTAHGYQQYGEYLTRVLKPEIDKRLRTLPQPEESAVMGSSLGGVVSMHIAWNWPHVFQNAACLSSSFGYHDDLFQRAHTDPIPPIRLYLDSGWPRDNFDVTRQMVELLSTRGMPLGEKLLYFAFPEAHHSETHWAARLHIPFQFLFGRSWRGRTISHVP